MGACLMFLALTRSSCPPLVLAALQIPRTKPWQTLSSSRALERNTSRIASSSQQPSS